MPPVDLVTPEERRENNRPLLIAGAAIANRIARDLEMRLDELDTAALTPEDTRKAQRILRSLRAIEAEMHA